MKTCFRSLSRVILFCSLLAHGVTAWPITFTNNTFIGSGDTNFDNQEILIANCTVTVDGSHTFAALDIMGGGVLTHSLVTNSQPGVPPLTLTVLSNATV